MANFHNNSIFQNYKCSPRSTLATTPRRRWVAALGLALAMSGASAIAAEPEPPQATPDNTVELFSSTPKVSLQALRAGQATVGRQAVQLNRAIADLPLHAKARFSLPQGGTYELVYDNRQDHSSGNVTWSGYLKDYGDDYRAVITFGSKGVSGRILTPDGEFLVESDASGEWLIDTQATGLNPMDMGEDALIPPSEEFYKRLSKLDEGSAPTGSWQDNQTVAIAAADTAPTTIDVMILYTPGLASRLGSNLSTRLDQLVALSNQAYRDSGIYINLRLVHAEQVNYSDTTTNSAALNALTYSSDPALANVASLRDTYGADLVSLIRPFNYSTSGGSCGVGWVGGYNGQPISLYANYGYSVISDGRDVNGSGYYCLDLSFTHELGHNMGSMHDRTNSGGGMGAYPYAFGYGVNGTFGTVMSYINPRIGKFSNPAITCAGGIACGVSEAVSDSANNALSLNNTRAAVASFRSAKTSNQKTSGDFDGDGKADLAGLNSTGTTYYTTDLTTWHNIPGTLSRLVAGDFNGDGKAALAGLTRNSVIYSSTNLTNWTQIPGALSRLVAGDFNGDGKADLAGVNSAGAIYYSTTLTNWTRIPGALSRLVTGDFNGDGKADLAGVNSNGAIYYTTNLTSWYNIPGTLSRLVAGDFNGDGKADLAGLNSNGAIYYSTNLTTWYNIPGALSRLVTGDFNGDGKADLAGLNSKGAIYYTTNCSVWTPISGQLYGLVGDID